jgi:hypothetical protein
MIKTIGGVKTVRHGGATNGQLSAFVMAPEQGFAITVLTNGSRGTELHNDVTKWALAHYLDAEELLPTPLNLDADALAAYAGHYDAALSSYDLEVRDGELWAQATSKGGFPYKDSKPVGPPAPPFRIAICADDMFVALDPPFKGGRGEFLRDPDGSLAWMRLGVRIAKRQ